MAKAFTSRLSMIVTLSLLALTIIGYWQRQYIYDQVRLYGYAPNSTINQLATDTTMTDGARRVFYVNRPELKDRDQFSRFCSNASSETAVLGCYQSPQRGIYLLQVGNVELDGIEEVTAAHEMLHAEYDRMSDGDRQRIDTLLRDFYKNDLKDESTRKTIEGYRKSEPNDLVNEMHSILGTQVTTLTPELEAHYKKYFTDRSKVAGYYQKYEQAFSSRQDQITNYDNQLEANKTSIDNLEASVQLQAADLKSRRARLNVQNSAEVSSYNSAIDRYNSDVRRLRTLIDTYNDIVEKRNAIAFEEKSLVDAISAPAAPKQ